MPSDPRHPLDKNVAADWQPVEGLPRRKGGMTFSDRLWHWLISLGGLAVAGFGVVVMWIVHWGKLGGIFVGVGIVIFFVGFPSQAQRNGYRE
jgi:hypothetical protein